MSKYFLGILLFFIVKGFAQVDKEPIPEVEEERVDIDAGNSIYGKVVKESNGRPVNTASVQLFMRVKSNGEYKDSLIRAMLTKANGDFSFDHLPAADSLHLQVSAIGHIVADRYFPFSTEGANVTRKGIGNIKLVEDTETLETVVVVAERPALRMGIDKKIFDVDKSITSKGGSAEDVMKNIPSVSVDVDGNVELRNSSPTIFVDGRPTILTLDQIPSENIDRVEIITNPSAKYDASSTGGIINIILKKNSRHGINGNVSLTGGTEGVFNANGNLNLRQDKFNFYISANHSQSQGEAKGNSLRQNKNKGVVTDYFTQNSINKRSRNFNSIRFGIDFFIDNRNTLSLSQGLVNGKFGSKERQLQEYMNLENVLEKYGTRKSENDFEFNRYKSEINYTHKFPEEGKELNASVNLNYGDVSENTFINNSFFNSDHSLNDLKTVRNDGDNNNHQLTAKIDFENPFGEDKKLEAGLRSYINNYESEFNSFSVKDGAETKLPLSNKYKYKEAVHAAYITYTGMLGSVGYQAGLRGEYSKFTGTLIDSARSFGYEYPSGIKNIWDALFPSLYLSKKLNEKEEIQLNYSRRIRRPGFWHLNPFIDINDPLNIQQGNPELKPEFRNSLEFNYSKNFSGGSNFLGVVYLRNTQGDITRYSDTLTAKQYEQLNNAAVDPNAILNTFINSNSSNRAGLELTWQQKFTPDFDITPSASISWREVKAHVKDLDLSNSGISWNGKLTANYKIRTIDDASLFNKLSFQLSGSYYSPRVLPQGKRLENFSADFAVRKDLLKNDRMTVTFSINDLFDSNKYGIIYDTEQFYQESYRRRRVRTFRLSLSYKFGNADFSLLKKNSRQDRQDPMDF